ncbi:MAG: hypothetical protein RIR70_1054 [Pseudomonadota bacterium]|jgi:ubiquinone biosynthesis protein UbiJ
MLNPAGLAAINHLLAAAPWARSKLSPFAGRVFAIQIPPLTFTAQVTAEGLLCEGEDTPRVEISLPPAALPFMMSGMDAVFRHARISGEAEFAEAIGFVARNLAWDAEEDLSRFIGDIAAHRAVGTARAILAWQKQSAVNFAENLAEYLTEENRLLMKPSPIKPFIEEVDALRDAIARLEKRVGRLGG